MTRAVFWYVLRSCEQTSLIDGFAARIHAALACTARALIERDPLRALHVFAHRALRQRSTRLPSSSLALIDAAQRMRDGLSQLPPRHRFVATAIHAHGCPLADVAQELGTSLGMTALYYEQARAMLRAIGSSVNAHQELNCASELLVAQAATHWLFRGKQLHSRAEFVSWTLSSPSHVRELLIGCADEWVLTVAVGWRPAGLASS